MEPDGTQFCKALQAYAAIRKAVRLRISGSGRAHRDIRRAVKLGCPFRVKPGNARREHMFSAVTPATDIQLLSASRFEAIRWPLSAKRNRPNLVVKVCSTILLGGARLGIEA